MTTTINEDVWWICWFVGVGGKLVPALLPGNEKGPNYLNEYDKRNFIKKTRITKTYVNFTLSSILADFPLLFGEPLDDSATKPQSVAWAASAPQERIAGAAHIQLPEK